VCGADLADDDEVVTVGRQRLTDPAVYRTAGVKGRGINVVDAQVDGTTQHRDRVLRK